MTDERISPHHPHSGHGDDDSHHRLTDDAADRQPGVQYRHEPADPTEYQFSNQQNKYMSLVSLLVILILALIIWLMTSR